MAQQPSSQGGAQDSGLGPVWVMVFLFLVSFLIWYYGHRQIVSFLFLINLAQAKLVHFVLGGQVLLSQIAWMSHVDPGAVSWDELTQALHEVGRYVAYPYAGVLMVLAVILFRSDVTRKFRRAHSMETLKAQEQENWPCIVPVVQENLAKTNINEGKWAMALSPMEFARKYQLLRREDPLTDGSTPKRTEDMTAGIRRVDAKRIFTLQLGAIWEGIDACPMHVQALAAVFMARMNRDRKNAALILEALDKTVASGTPDYSLVPSILSRYKQLEIVQETVSQHAYVLTVMASLLQASRQDGVVPSAEFLWLKLVDRRLWYMLNCVGRQTPFSEVAGPFAHWRAEQAMGRACLLPMVDEAIKALEIAIKEVKLSPKELRGLRE